MGINRKKVTYKSDCFKWIQAVMQAGINEFWFTCLPTQLKNKSMLHRACASGLLTQIDIDNHGQKQWKLNIFEINRIKERYNLYWKTKNGWNE